MDHRRRRVFHFLLFPSSSPAPLKTLYKMLRIWTATVTALLVLLGSSNPVSCYRVSNEALTRSGCLWSNNRNSTSPPPSPPQLTLNCNVRTLNTEFWNSTFTPEQIRSTAALQVKCNDRLYFESHLRLNQSFSQLLHLQSVSFDSCKIRKVPRGIWDRFQELRTLTIRTQNSDWSPSIGLELETNCFQGLPQLTSLDLSSSNVWALPDQLLCPHLTNLLKFNLSSNRLVEVPDEFSSVEPSSGSGGKSSCAPNVESVDLSRNLIRRVGRAALSRLSTLTQLRLQQNLVEELEDAAFAGLGRVRFLNLSSNRLVALPPTIFKSNPMLRELYLQNNSLTALSPAVFSSLSQLVMLDLSLNALSSLWIRESVFQGLGQLIVLRLNSNQLTHIDPTIFKTLVNLQSLHLDSNRIETIHPEALSSLTNLHLLDLSRNRLTTITERLLSSGVLLRTLALDHNKITSVSEGALDNCTNLQDLGLAGNNLAEVPSALRTGLRLLRTLDIGENRIVSVSNESFHGLEELYGLRLVDNRLIELPPSFCNSLKRLRVLNLAQNRLNQISSSAFTGCPELRALRMDSNSLEELPPSLSTQLPSLLWLNVSVNRIRWADYHVLPRSIEWLDLSFNSLESLGGGVSEKVLRNPIPSTAFHLRVLDASHNRLTKLDITTIPPSLETLRLNQNLLRSIAPDTFSRSAHLRRIELVGNRLEGLPLSVLTFPPVPPSRALPELFLGGNPFTCDCSMEWLTRLNHLQLTVLRQHPRLMDPDAVRCRLTQAEDPEELVPLPDAKPSQFLCPYKSHCFPLCHCCDFDACDCEMTCPGNCSCFHDTPWSVNIVQCSGLDYQEIPARIPMEATELYLDGNGIPELGSHIFIGKKNLRILHLNGSRVELIKNKTFNGLKSLEILRLEENLLTQLGGWEFRDLPNLRELYLQHNRLTSLSGDTFSDLKFLQVLRIDGNRLVDFNVWELSGNGYLNSVMLSANPWSCECEFVIPFRAWSSVRTSIVVDFSLAKCQLVTGEENGRTGSENETTDSALLLQPTLSSICNNELDPGPRDEENVIGSMDDGGGSAERQAVLEPDESLTGGSDSVQLTPMLDMESSVMLAIVLSSGVCLILIISLLLIFRQEICALCCSHPRRKSGGVRWGLPPWCGGSGGKKTGFGSPSAPGPNNSTSLGERQEESEKLFDAYFIYNSEDEEILTEKLIPELEDKGGNRFRLCLHRDLCLGLENPWNLEMVLSAAESSKRIVILLSKTFLQKEWTNNTDFRRALQSTLSRHQKKLIFILLPPLSVPNLPSLLTIFPELKAAATQQPLSQGTAAGILNLLEWADPQFRIKLRKLFPLPTASDPIHRHHHHPPGQTFSNVHSILSHSQHQPRGGGGGEADWPYTNNFHPQFHQAVGMKEQQVAQSWSHHNHHHHHFHPNRAVHPSMGPPVTHGFYEHGTSSMIPIPLHHPIMFSGQCAGSGSTHHHEHQNSVSTISNTYPPLTEQNLSDSTNTLGSLGSEEHVYSTLDTPLQSPQGHGRAEQVNIGPSQGSSPSGGHMYFV